MYKGHQSIIRRYAYACELLDRGTDEDLRQAFVNFDQIIDLTVRRLILERMIERSLVEKFGGELLLKKNRQRRQELLSAFLQQKGMRTSVHDLRDIQEQRNRFYHEDVDILPSRSLLVDVSRHVQDIMRVAFNIDVSEAVQQIAFDSMLQKSGASVLQNRPLRIGARVLELATRVAEHFDVTDTAALSVEGILEEWTILNTLNNRALSFANRDMDILVKYLDDVRTMPLCRMPVERVTEAADAARSVSKALRSVSRIAMTTRARQVWDLPEDISHATLEISEQAVVLVVQYADGVIIQHENPRDDVLVNAPNAALNKVQKAFNIPEEALYEQPMLQGRFGVIFNRDCLLDTDEIAMANNAGADLWKERGPISGGNG